MDKYPVVEGMGLIINGIVYKVTSVRVNGTAIIKPRGKATEGMRSLVFDVKKPWWKIWG